MTDAGREAARGAGFVPAARRPAQEEIRLTGAATPSAALGAFDPFEGVQEIVVDHGYARANVLPAAAPRAAPRRLRRGGPLPRLNRGAIRPEARGAVAQPWRVDLSISCRTARAPTL